MGSDGKFRGEALLISNMSCLVQPCRIMSGAKTIDNASWSDKIFSLEDKSQILGSQCCRDLPCRRLWRRYTSSSKPIAINPITVSVYWHARSSRGTTSSAGLSRNGTNLASIICNRWRGTDRRQNARVDIGFYKYRLPKRHIVSYMSNMGPQAAKEPMQCQWTVSGCVNQLVLFAGAFMTSSNKLT